MPPRWRRTKVAHGDAAVAAAGARGRAVKGAVTVVVKAAVVAKLATMTAVRRGANVQASPSPDAQR